jgi:hypothetical protein
MNLRRFLLAALTLIPTALSASEASAYYAAHLGRWLVRDPVEYQGEFNLYGYLGDAPTGAVDPLGLYQMGLAVACNQSPPPPPPRKIPPCPKKNPGGSQGDGWCSEGQNRLHPGSKECFREITSGGGTSGNQCCYDGNGDLITDGPGAGTPDERSPACGENSRGECRWNVGGVAEHLIWDVIPHVCSEIWQGL